VVIVEVPGKDAKQVDFVEDNEVVQAVAANGANEPFAVRVCVSRRLHRIVTMRSEHFG